jgi:multiple sugar transport system permease protein
VIYLAAPMLGLLLALFLNQTMRGIRAVRALFLMPFVVSQVLIGLIFAWFLNPEFGLLNPLLAKAGLGPVAPLENEDWAIVGVIAAGLWPQTAYCMVLYLTGLTGLRPELIESARLDGARDHALLWHVVLPQLRPVTFIAAMVCVVSALRSFDLVMIMTAGGPYNSTNVLAYYMYEQTFLSLRYGYAAAIATVLFALMGCCVAFFLWRLLSRERG